MSDRPDDRRPLWGGRFRQSPDQLLERYTGSLHLDRRLALYDLKGTRAHVRMLTRQGILSGEEEGRILEACEQIEQEIVEERFDYRPELEDIHMNLEARLHELAGEAGRKVHTGRSRNDQVLVDVKLFCLDTAAQWLDSLRRAIEVAVARADRLQSSLLPAWTHMQTAQPISWAHYLLALCEMFGRDHDRLTSYRSRHSVSPLGAGALAGSSLPLDPAQTAAELGFGRAFGNSYDVAGDRDFVLELVQAASQVMIHASRIAADFVYFSSTPVGWVELPDSLCTGSSMMPQKKNPDLLELARGKAASVQGHAHALATLLTGLPTSYHRDLQQDKEHLFAAADLVSETLEVLAAVLERFEVREERCREALAESFATATDLAERLVVQGVPFRTAHERVGRLVAHCLERGLGLADLDLEQLREQIPEADASALAALRPESALDARRYPGSAGRGPTRQRLREWQRWLADLTRGPFFLDDE